MSVIHPDLHTYRKTNKTRSPIGPSIPTFPNHIMHYADNESLPPNHNIITTTGPTLYSTDPYTTTMGLHPCIKSYFASSPGIELHVSSGFGIGAYTDVHSCNFGSFHPGMTNKSRLFDINSIPRVWNMDCSSVQSDNCVSSPGVSHETTDITINNDYEQVQCESSSQSEAAHSSISESNIRCKSLPLQALIRGSPNL